MIKQYSRVLLKTNEEASIVEILEKEKLFIADIDRDDDTYTETIKIEDIEKILKQ